MNQPIAEASRKEFRWRVVLLAAILALAVGVSGLFAFRAADQKAAMENSDQLAALETRYAQAEGKVDALTQQVIALGAQPVVAPLPSSAEITQAQANFAYSVYCGEDPERCRGEAGRSLTAADALRAITRYCGDDCKVSQDEILKAVVRSCEMGEVQCRGPQGPAGEPGEDGARGDNGVGISSVSCVSGGFVFDLSDGRVLGPFGDCVAEQGPPGEPAPTLDFRTEGCSDTTPYTRLEFKQDENTVTLTCSGPSGADSGNNGSPVPEGGLR